MIGLDYAGSSPGAAAVKAAGYGFVARYLSRYSSKTIKKPEYDDMTRNGVAVVLVFEDYANQALNGWQQGVDDANVALAQANAIGWPANRPIHFAVDFDISDAQKPAAGQYMKGAAAVLGLSRVGAYGGYWWIKYCADNNLAAPNARWQAVAWSGGNIHPTATLFQQLGGVTVNGTSCDVNKQLKPDFGQSNMQGDEMITAPQQLNALFLAFRGRAPQQGEFDAYLNKISYNDMVVMLDSPDSSERVDTIKALNTGKRALQDGWADQIYSLQDQVKAKDAALAADEKKVVDALAAQKKAEDNLKKLQDQTNADTQTGNAFLRWLGGILGKNK